MCIILLINRNDEKIGVEILYICDRVKIVEYDSSYKGLYIEEKRHKIVAVP